MRNVAILLAIFIAAAAPFVVQARKYLFCATDSITDAECRAIKKDDSQVNCLRVTDNVECAIQLSRSKADFGVFNVDELLLAYQFFPNDIVPIMQLKHPDRSDHDFEFQSVAVTTMKAEPLNSERTFEGLRGGGLCHPGFSDAQWWNDYVLKYFERKVYDMNCRLDTTANMNEMENIKDFFGSACRPGEWAPEKVYDSVLKNHYPELCSLCENKASCKYENMNEHGHLGALNCLKSGKGKVAYVALEYVRQFFNKNDTFRFLCPDGKFQNSDTIKPCTWIDQPWGVIVARKDKAAELKKDLDNWLKSQYAADSWSLSLNKILQKNYVAKTLPDNTTLTNYLAKGRDDVNLTRVKTCGYLTRWCTTSDLETKKCQWVSNAAVALGIEPRISCNKANSTFQCFRDIAQNRADVIAIDSNYGQLAREVYNLSTILYGNTNENSVIMAVVREEKDDYPIKSLHHLKGRKACFPEYGGIAWLSFINVARINAIVSTKSCDYPKLAADLFAGACTPGIQDNDHSNASFVLQSDVGTKLCSVCPLENNDAFCSATNANKYYGDAGALKCLSDKAGDIAFVEIKNLREADNIDQHMYRVLCKNSSLANPTGFKFDKPELCALSVTIDSEILGRRKSSEAEKLNIMLSLIKIENWLGYRIGVQRPMHIYEEFDGVPDLLFKNSTIALSLPTSDTPSIVAYKELFKHLETCSSAVSTAVINVALTALLVILPIFHNQML